MNGGTWLRSKQAADHFGVCPATVRRWADSGLIVYKRTAGNQRVYDVSGGKPECTTKISYIYARVSSKKQEDDLQRQVEMLRSKYPDNTLIKDFGSGLNFKRKGLLKLIELSYKGLVKQVVVASKDRLCRFGFDLLEWQFQQNNVELVVLDKSDKSPELEFTEDILAVLQVFACRWNGKRKYSFKNKKNQVTVNIDTNEGIEDVE